MKNRNQIAPSPQLDTAQLLQLVLDTIPQKVFWKDTESVYLGCNQEFAEVAGLDRPDDIIGCTDFDLPWTHEQAEFYRDYDRRVMTENAPEVGIIETQTNSEGELTWLETSKVPLVDSAGNVIGILGSFHDITKIKQAEQALQQSNEQLEKSVRERTSELQFIAQHDGLTNLLNRRHFVAQLASLIEERRPFGLLFIDLDRFKAVNDTLGHGVGDELLVQVSAILRSCIPSDTVGRFGGDEFTLLMPDIENGTWVTETASQILRALYEDVVIDGSRLNVTASIGIVIDLVGSYSSASDALRDCDIAMYEAKREGRGRHRVFNKEMLTRAQEQLTLDSQIRAGLANDEFHVAYQPIVDLRTGKVSSLEALVRWTNPELGLVMPDRFLELAESTGLIAEIGQFVLASVCHQLANWRKNAPQLTAQLSVNVNLSAVQLRCSEFTEFVASTIADSGLQPQDIGLEITESMMMEDDSGVEDQLQLLRSRGHQLSLDDFGTGYSSLSYLHRFPLDVLKIDRSFVWVMDSDRTSRAIVKTIITLAEALGLGVVAEGVETPSQEILLRQLGCRHVQGFGYSEPLGAAETLEFLYQHDGRPLQIEAPSQPGTNPNKMEHANDNALQCSHESQSINPRSDAE